MSRESLGLILMLPLLLAAQAATAPSASTPMENFRYSATFEILNDAGAVEETMPPMQIICIGDRAAAIDFKGEVRVRFDLKNPAMRAESGDHGTLSELQKRAADQRDRVFATINDYKDPARIKTLYEPNLKAEQNGQTLKLSSELTTYEIQLEPIAQPQRSRLYMVQRLQDYMNPRIDIPPYSSLAVTDELEKRQCYGKVVTVKTRGADGIDYRIRTKGSIAPLSDEEVRKYTPLMSPPK
jgi:hypothetical protein